MNDNFGSKTVAWFGLCKPENPNEATAFCTESMTLKLSYTVACPCMPMYYAGTPYPQQTQFKSLLPPIPPYLSIPAPIDLVPGCATINWTDFGSIKHLNETKKGSYKKLDHVVSIHKCWIIMIKMGDETVISPFLWDGLKVSDIRPKFKSLRHIMFIFGQVKSHEKVT